ncbi:arylesterase [Thauera linaloolentis]|uniref:G-D-S-L family lipolytic protein n=1 Tax=Thauera linaloolentis (strain DSM 12138 / JCM 21573 / CCUG 41526 / CIP 105981 / IAM 15112 / NBRC 102519 / 47Lol) TaxID=1123367 RepID=N6YSQ9_THAL4|nr:GDSL-type esterase/lipase family protein [Thauera linaloolentis]ENO85233.1 G-D-S-L family lipolytic protein [Thauera linaloolentis 47Lol = DSM 12138]MCM8565110.1 arylesterase [Thauera linaloolentis]
MNRRRFILALTMAALAAACGREPKLPALPDGARVLAFGDSVTYGTGAGEGEDWPALLAASAGWEVVNAGVPGDTALAGQHRLQALLDEFTPALVVVEIGGNDFLRRRSEGEVKEDLRRIVRMARASGAQVVLVGVPVLSLSGAVIGRLSDAPLYAALADEEGVPLVPDVFSEVLSQPDLRADRIHPNAQGYRRMAAGIHARLREIGLAR